MKIVRWLAVLAAAACLLQAGAATAQPYPSKPIRLIIPFGPGSGSDILARILAEPLTQALGQPIIIDNKPGNNTTLGTELVVQSPPDFRLDVPNSRRPVDCQDEDQRCEECQRDN